MGFKRWGSTVQTKIFTDGVKHTGDFWDVGNFYRYRLQIPQNFGLVTLGEGKWGRKKYRRIPKCEGD